MSRRSGAALLLVVMTAQPATALWHPGSKASWQWQLQGRLDTSIEARVYNIDGFDNGKSLVAKLHDKGRRVICYISAGSWERWRPDADRFPKEVLGKRLDGWVGERWLDVRRIAILKDLMKRRVKMCARKGFDGIEFDNVDAYQNDSGFDLKPRQQLRFNKMLARLAHDHGLAAGLKNDLAQVTKLEPMFEFAVNEQCFLYRECFRLDPFIAAGKPVFHVEYEMPRSKFCKRARELGFSSMRKRYSLKVWRRPC